MHNRVKRLTGIILLPMLLMLLIPLAPTSPAHAQDAPPNTIYVALQDLSARLGRQVTIDDMILWEWSADERYSESSLGCPLVQGLPISPVLGYIFTFNFANGASYEYRVSADRAIVVPCSPSLLEANATVTVGTDKDGDFIPDVYDQCPNDIGHESTNGCPYPAIENDADGDLVQENGADKCPDQFGLQSLQGCPPGVVSSAYQPRSTGSCTLSAGEDGYANVRQAPSITAEQINTIYGITEYPITARNSDGSWYFSEGLGWVASYVIWTYGSCASIPVATDLPPVGQPVGQCQITAAEAGFANIRETPSFTADQVNTIYGSDRYAVEGQSADGQWFKINLGWVAKAVVWQFGACGNVQTIQ